MSNMDKVYYERNALACLLAGCVNAIGGGIGLKAGMGKDPAQPEEWQNVVYIDLPTGQISFHIHERERHLFDDLPWYGGKWDGHTDTEKWERVTRQLASHR